MTASVKDSAFKARAKIGQERAKKLIGDPDNVRMADGNFFSLDEKRNILIYNPLCNNYGEIDRTAYDSAKNMLSISKFFCMPVEATFNTITFQVTPKMSLQDAERAWDFKHYEFCNRFKDTMFEKAKNFLNTMPLSVRKKLNMVFGIDEKKQILTYNPKKNQEASGVIENMRKISHVMHLPIEATLDGRTFQIKPYMTQEEAVDIWQKSKQICTQTKLNVTNNVGNDSR